MSQSTRIYYVHRVNAKDVSFREFCDIVKQARQTKAPVDVVVSDQPDGKRDNFVFFPDTWTDHKCGGTALTAIEMRRRRVQYRLTLKDGYSMLHFTRKS